MHNQTRGLQENVNGLIVTATGTLECANTNFRGARKAVASMGRTEALATVTILNVLSILHFFFVYLCVRRKNYTSNKLCNFT